MILHFNIILKVGGKIESQEQCYGEGGKDKKAGCENRPFCLFSVFTFKILIDRYDVRGA